MRRDQIYNAVYAFVKRAEVRRALVPGPRRRRAAAAVFAGYEGGERGHGTDHHEHARVELTATGAAQPKSHMQHGVAV